MTWTTIRGENATGKRLSVPENARGRLFQEKRRKGDEKQEDVIEKTIILTER
jgi:hypothetical protein